MLCCRQTIQQDAAWRPQTPVEYGLLVTRSDSQEQLLSGVGLLGSACGIDARDAWTVVRVLRDGG